MINVTATDWGIANIHGSSPYDITISVIVETVCMILKKS